MSSGADRRSAGPCRGGDFRTPYRPVGFGAPADVRERITIGVPATVVYAAVSDVRRMGEWSPECVGATLAEPDAEPVTGTRFTGRNRIGRWRAWTTRCIVTVADRPRCFAFDVSLGGRVATWRFDLIPSPDGTSTEVVQSWWERRGPARRRLSALTSGIGDRATHNKATMRVSLRRLKRAMERA